MVKTMKKTTLMIVFILLLANLHYHNFKAYACQYDEDYCYPLIITDDGDVYYFEKHRWEDDSTEHLETEMLDLLRRNERSDIDVIIEALSPDVMMINVGNDLFVLEQEKAANYSGSGYYYKIVVWQIPNNGNEARIIYWNKQTEVQRFDTFYSYDGVLYINNSNKILYIDTNYSEDRIKTIPDNIYLQPHITDSIVLGDTLYYALWSHDYNSENDDGTYDIYRTDASVGSSRIIIESMPANQLIMVAGDNEIYLVQYQFLGTIKDIDMYPIRIVYTVSIWSLQNDIYDTLNMVFRDTSGNIPMCSNIEFEDGNILFIDNGKVVANIEIAK